MLPRAVQFPSEHFYDSKLRDSLHVQRRSFPGHDPSVAWMRPYVFLDVAGQEQKQQSRSLTNVAESRVVVAVLRKLLATPGVSAHQCVVVTFYSAQRDLIAASLRSQQWPAGGTPRVHTVDSFQGSEADVVVCSFVRGNANANVGFLGDFKRLNVALTRARHSLVICANWATMANSQSHHLSRLAADARSRGLVLDARCVDLAADATWVDVESVPKITWGR